MLEDDLGVLEVCRTKVTEDLDWAQRLAEDVSLQSSSEFRTLISALQHLTDKIEQIKEQTPESAMPGFD